MSTSPPARSRPSQRWQFSILTLLVAMTWVGLVCVALGSPGELWAGMIFVLAVGSLLVASLCIVYREGRARAFAVGFVIFGTTYFVVSMGDTPDVPDAHSQLPTTRWGIALYSLLHGDKLLTTQGPVYPTPVYAPPLPLTALSPPPPGTTIERVVVSTTAPSDPSSDLEVAVAPAAASAPVPWPALPPPVTTYVARTTTQSLVPLGSFLEVVHRVLAMLLGVIGGVVAQILYSTRRDKEPVAQPTARDSPS
jgi:hypothetical protein